MITEIKRIGTGARMSEAVCYNGVVWVAGQVGTPGDPVAAQTRTCLAEACPAALGCALATSRSTRWSRDGAEIEQATKRATAPRAWLLNFLEEVRNDRSGSYTPGAI